MWVLAFRGFGCVSSVEGLSGVVVDIVRSSASAMERRVENGVIREGRCV